ncbi:hypothetical protein BQ8482_430001 [Mesorhizobium delmotii]|uniref:Uncharacterized protein n=1 Tax=Mesorhizobium delmotii TaxID=1631247 RepID=A0A2P9ATB3_9HYPH|nr:hypothetical protein BQ8482_430001 [Mesorhizobium delmotii]
MLVLLLPNAGHQSDQRTNFLIVMPPGSIWISCRIDVVARSYFNLTCLGGAFGALSLRNHFRGPTIFALPANTSI